MKITDEKKIKALFDEFYKKFPEPREDMTIEREREFVSAYSDVVEKIGFVDKFWSPFDLYPQDRFYLGLPFKVIGRCTEGKDWDLESLPAWKIQFEDGYELNVYPEEIFLPDMKNNGYEGD